MLNCSCILGCCDGHESLGCTLLGVLHLVIGDACLSGASSQTFVHCGLISTCAWVTLSLRVQADSAFALPGRPSCVLTTVLDCW